MPPGRQRAVAARRPRSERRAPVSSRGRPDTVRGPPRVPPSARTPVRSTRWRTRSSRRPTTCRRRRLRVRTASRAETRAAACGSRATRGTTRQGTRRPRGTARTERMRASERHRPPSIQHRQRHHAHGQIARTASLWSIQTARATLSSPRSPGLLELPSLLESNPISSESPPGARASRPPEQSWACRPLRAGRPSSQDPRPRSRACLVGPSRSLARSWSSIDTRQRNILPL